MRPASLVGHARHRSRLALLLPPLLQRHAKGSIMSDNQPASPLPETVEEAIRPIRTDLATWMPVDNREAWADKRCDTLRAAIRTALAQAREEEMDSQRGAWQAIAQEDPDWKALSARAERLRRIAQAEHSYANGEISVDAFNAAWCALIDGDLADDLQPTQEEVRGE